MYQQNIGAYQRSDVLTADPMALVLICYNAAISNLKIAKARYLDKQYEAKAIATNKALDIISELLSGLNFEKGGDIAKNLDAIYRYLLNRIHHGDVNRDLSPLDEAITILEELREAWNTIHSSKDLGKTTQPAPQHSGLQAMRMA